MTQQASATATDAPAVGSAGNVGPYKIIGRLGKGGMAEVLLTMQHDPMSGFKRLVVVKRVLPELKDEDPQFIKMFLDEARLAARLNHANVVQTFEVGQDGEIPYLAMEFLEGQSLNVVQRRAHGLKQPMPFGVALKIFGEALEGLHYAHELKDFDGRPLNVIHRDVTPSNIFITYDGTTKLVDFGIAKSATQREKTRAGVLKGKMAYMAPEQFRDMPITRSVDVWSMGIVIWETIAGERLFRGKNDFETVQAVMKREIPRLSARRSDVPAALDDVLAAAIHRDPSKRIPTAEEFKNRLDEVAFSLGRPLKRTDVSQMMQDLFADAIGQNQRLVKDFLEREDVDLAAQHEYLRVKSTGTIEVRQEGDTKTTQLEVNPAEMSMPSTTLSGLESANRRKSVLPAEASVPSMPRPPRVPSRAPAPLDESALEEDDEARPVWHWIVLAAALLVMGAAVWLLLST